MRMALCCFCAGWLVGGAWQHAAAQPAAPFVRFEEGDRLARVASAARDSRGVLLDAVKASGEALYLPDRAPLDRHYLLQVHGTTRPQSVIADGRPLAEHKTREAWDQATSGWWYTLEQDQNPMTHWYARKLLVKLPPAPAERGSTVRLEGTAIGRYYQ